MIAFDCQTKMIIWINNKKIYPFVYISWKQFKKFIVVEERVSKIFFSLKKVIVS